MHLKLPLIFVLLLCGQYLFSQKVNGVIIDEKSGEPVIGCNVIVKGTTQGVTTDFDGKFELQIKPSQFPIVLQASFIGYQTQEVNIAKAGSVNIKLSEDKAMLNEVSVVEQRLSEKQRESALTVEALDGLAIKETPAVNFYEALGNLKGVDLTSASIGFKVINTRGFNSTSPVRSLQLIDGVDNQAPGLNFSLGNFLGASELDIQTVDIIAGASSAFYGPGAFNGVISMTTKNPFLYQGVSASVKVGERNLTETAVRYAEAFKVGKNKDYENLAFKINLFYLKANDWEANNYNPVDDSEVDANNPGGYDAVNIYGDEALSVNNNADNIYDVKQGFAGLGQYYRPGYKEADIVDYNTKNFKGNIGLYYKITPKVELSYNFNYGTGTTVYQGENRFSLKDIRFAQNVVEIKQKDKFFIRAYSTQEDAGNSYDAVLTAFKMNQAIASDGDWYSSYRSNWTSSFFNFDKQFGDAAGVFFDTILQPYYNTKYQDLLREYSSLLTDYHNTLKDFHLPHPEPGSAAYDSLFNYVTSRTFTEGGSRFYDKSRLYHVAGEYQFNPSWATIRVGGNYRLYAPDSRGNIFDEIDSIHIVKDSIGNEIDREFYYRKIRNAEFGVYAGIEKKFGKEKFIANGTIRLDKNENFPYLVSPALSLVYNVNDKNTVRVSFGSAIRNPTLQDQFLRYDVGRAILLGNINGYDSLVTLESFDFYRNQENQLRKNLDFFNVDPIEPERVRTFELGYRATMFKRLFLDANYYFNWYTNFIGYQFGLDFDFFPGTPNIVDFNSIQAYRIAANSKGLVTTQGLNVGLNYYLTDELSLNGNYSYNEIDLTPNSNFINKTFFEEELANTQSDDPIVPAYNTPRNKFNVGITGRGYKLLKNKDHKAGFAVTYKWVQGFVFEGSPQFSGFINDYALTDAQVSYQVPNIYCTFKLGSSNIFNNKVYQVYGGPQVGRMAYFSILVEII